MSEDFTDFEVQVSTEDVEAWGGEQRPLVPAGSDYSLTVTGMKQETIEGGPNAGATKIEVEFTVAEGEHAGSKVWNNYPLTQKAMGRIKALQVACRAQLDKIVASQFMGVTIKADIIHQEGNQRVDQNGNPLPIRTFANVINERPLEEAVQTQQAPAVKQPPVTKQAAPPAANKQNSAGAPRRA